MTMTPVRGEGGHLSGGTRYVHDQITKAKGKVQLALNAAGSWHQSPEQVERLLHDLQQLQAVIDELDTTLTNRR